MTFGLETVGFAAGTLTAFCFLPQALKIIVTRDTKAISLASQLAFTLGTGLWVVYGMWAQSPSIVLFNAVSALLGATITVMKVRFG